MQGGASWREPRLVAKLARILQNDDFSDFELLQCEIPKFVWALTWGKRYFIRFPVGWWKPQAQIKQRAGDFNSLGFPMKPLLANMTKIMIFEALRPDLRRISC